ncbi:helix-turn-helix domain-containing protein [Iningainema tapete]|uniref:Helix-turn-helix transcriptional regulator n=1 Tax=Iningainema tapete BLCC-T55 TaxID=2748662 RepID=A0A8J7BXB9_9CYAN|nr:helix-turn-helix domain-containing protein [Iningainema tapete]MBD2773522.1 helix-turn-helix transcriptional regulator [Iningainema tapete BLCC-T55]
MPRSLKVASQYIKKVKAALHRNGFPRQQNLAEDLGMSRDTVSRFLNGKPISYLNFEEICQKLGLNLQEIADFETEDNEILELVSSVEFISEQLLSYGELSDTQSTTNEVEALPPKPHLLFDLLLQMDFKQQVSLVKKVMELHRIAGFLVHGEPYCGQQLLVTRLFRLKPKWKNISPIKIDVSHNGVGRSIPHLWRQLTSWFGLPKDAEPNQIIEKVCDRLLTQDVIFIFYTVDYMQPKVLTEWLQAFWEQLVATVEPSPSTQRDTHLLMFLVDNSGSVCQSNILLAQQFNEPDYPRIPLHLPPVAPFPLDVLDDWIDTVTAMQTVQIPAGLTSQILLEKSNNGIPQDVYEEICCHCGHNWEGELAKWLI